MEDDAEGLEVCRRLAREIVEKKGLDGYTPASYLVGDKEAEEIVLDYISRLGKDKKQYDH
jgi:hypothetical protein